jgi:hypothetical protein
MVVSEKKMEGNYKSVRVHACSIFFLVFWILIDLFVKSSSMSANMVVNPRSCSLWRWTQEGTPFGNRDQKKKLWDAMTAKCCIYYEKADLYV